MPAAVPTAPTRLLALDWMRGLVMALMAVDHVDGALNPRHSNLDGVMMGGARASLSIDFATRFGTHLCAPTFVFLAGTSLALSAARARQRGGTARQFDRHLAARGLLLLGLEVTLMSFYWRQGGLGVDVLLQVLFALGAGMLAMVPLRRLPTAALVAMALLLPLGCEAVVAALPPTGAPAAVQLLCSGGVLPWRSHVVMVLYPALPWFPPMLLGFAFGRALARGLDAAAAARGLIAAGALALALFALLRFADRPFTNMQLQRRDDSLLQWLHVSKYPPSVTFLLLELGLMALLLAVCFWLQQRRGAGRWRWQPLVVLGQVPLFFYLLHLPLIGLLMGLGVLTRPQPWPISWLGALLVLLLAWPCCLWYRRCKQRGHAFARWL